MTPIHFLWYSIISILDVLAAVVILGGLYSMTNAFYEKRLRIGYTEKFKFMANLASETAKDAISQHPTENIH